VKRCPICKTQYSDEAEYCASCKTLLLKEEDPKENEKPKNKVNVKGLVWAIVSTCAFIGLMIVLYNILARIR
jgi:hypothetical protein